MKHEVDRDMNNHNNRSLEEQKARNPMSCKMINHPRATTKTCPELVRQAEVAECTLTRLDSMYEISLDLDSSGGERTPDETLRP